MSERNDQASKSHDERERELGELLRGGAAYHPASPALRLQVTRSLRARNAPLDAERWYASWPAWRAVGAGFACGAIATWLAFALPLNIDLTERTSNEVIAAHARSLLAAHATDVASGDQHTVKPWLSARLDFSPPVPELSADGFPLAGGRLDYIAERPVAALLYRRHQHVINVFIWPSPDAARASSAKAVRKGFSTVSWQHDGMQYWVVTDLGDAELNDFTQMFRRRIAEPRSS